MSGKKINHKLLVRYAETDQMGIVYYANYLVWFEAARTDFLRAIGMPYKQLEEEGLLLPVIEAYVKYISPAYYEDEITVETWVKTLKPISIIISYKVFRKGGSKPIAHGFTKHAVINKKGKIIKMSDKLYKKLSEYVAEK